MAFGHIETFVAGINRQRDRLRLLIPALKNGERIGVAHNLSQSHTYRISCRRKLSAYDKLTRHRKTLPRGASESSHNFRSRATNQFGAKSCYLPKNGEICYKNLH